MATRGKLVVLGSINADHILTMTRFPSPGETVIGRQYQISPGGKGANQAVAAARASADTIFIACTGDDAAGEQMCRQFVQDGINTSAIDRVSQESTGVALIYLNAAGENTIAIHAGANAALTPARVLNHQLAIEQADALLMQLESPIESIQLAAEIAKHHHTRVIFNPAPATKLTDELLALVDIITPNETEAQILTGITISDDKSVARAASIFHQKGIADVLITMGHRGVWLSQQGFGRWISGFRVDAVDTVAAGDTFNGALVTALLEGQSLEQAVDFGQAAAAISVTRQGGQPSIPWRNEIAKFLRQQK